MIACEGWVEQQQKPTEATMRSAGCLAQLKVVGRGLTGMSDERERWLVR